MLRSVLRTAGAFAVSAALVTGILAIACSDDVTTRDLGGTSDGGRAGVVTDGRAADSQGAPASATLRIAHLAPGVGPIDFCYQGAKKGTFIGPVLGAATAAADAGEDAAPPQNGEEPPGDAGDAGETPIEDAGAEGPRPSASYRTVTRYIGLQAAGPITIAVLAAGATSCAGPLATVDVTLDPGKLATLALFARPADGGVEITGTAFTDDPATFPEKIRARVIHAALGSGALAVRAVAARTTVLADRVEPRRASTPSAVVDVDALGYRTSAPIPGPTAIAIGQAAGDDAGADGGLDPWQSTASDLDLRGGSLHSAFVLRGEGDAPFEVLWCADTTTSGDQTSCRLLR